MKVVIFAGGLGTRLSEETSMRPKPMVEIGGRPILWHIMKMYDHYGFNDFIICLGYKGYVIKEYFYNYFLHHADIRIDTSHNSIEILNTPKESFKITLVDTGLDTMTAGRLRRIKPYLDNETFMLTYGDGVSDIHLRDLLEFHRKHGKKATVTSVQPDGKFGGMQIQPDGQVSSFTEKPKGDGHWINAGFFVLEPGVFDFFPESSDHIMWEEMPMKNLTEQGQLVAYKYEGFWKCMDALRDKIYLEERWSNNNAPWKTWME